jgi:hypothetical protein
MRKLAASLVAVLLVGCTPYQKMGFMGGVDELQVSDVTYRITAKGNGYTSADRVEDYVMLRASEIAISRGYPGFTVDSVADRSRVGEITTAGQARTTTVVSGGVANSTTTYTPATTHLVFKPGTAVFITLVRDGGMDARMIYAQLAPKYVSDKDRLDQAAPLAQPDERSEK